MRIKSFSTFVAAVFAVTILQTPAGAEEKIKEPHASNQVIVAYRQDTSEASKRNAEKLINGSKSKDLMSAGQKKIELLQIGKGLSVESAISKLKSDPNVLYAEPDYILQKTVVPNDPYYSNSALWGMYGPSPSSPANAFGSNAVAAWAAGYTGNSSVVVGVIDEGIQVTHPDLLANIWVNPGEIAGDGVDNDLNGKIDDVNGWDFFNNDASVYDGGTDGTEDSHGTHVAGTIGAVGNNGLGVAGVNWNVKIVSAKFLDTNGGYTSGAISAVNYLVDLKSRGTNIVAINNSWGGGGFSQSLLDAINLAGNRGMFFVVAAGNSADNNDLKASYPSGYVCTNVAAFDCVVAVASTTSTGALSPFSNYGASTVDIGAPGSGIWSTVPNNFYASYSGTSMASPHVAGAIALCASVNSALTAGAIRSKLSSSVQPTASLAGKVLTGGRLDVGALINLCLPSSKLAQAPLVITNSAIIGLPANSPVLITYSGGTGSGSELVTATGANCSLAGTTLSVTTATTCTVTVTKSGDEIYNSRTSSPVDFKFVLIAQTSAVIATFPAPYPSSYKVGTNYTIAKSGGSGTGSYSFGVSGQGCSIGSITGVLRASKITTCTVWVNRAASGVYLSARSINYSVKFIK
ncbi:MAG: hypothetical protein RI895_646 [Actinomycetota bacterium]